MLAEFVSPCRIKQKRRWVRRPTSGRTVYGYVGGDPVDAIDPLGLFEISAVRGPRGVFFQMHFGSAPLQAANEVAPAFFGALGRVGKWLQNSDKVADKVKGKFGNRAGMCDIDDPISRVKAAALDPEIAGMYKAKGYEAGPTGTALTEQGLRGFLNEAYRAHPELRNYYPSVDVLIQNASDRAIGRRY